MPAVRRTASCQPPDEQQQGESSHDPKEKPLKANTGIKARRTAVVVASQSSENATWLEEYFPEWEKNIYRVDDANAPLTVPKNKGRESMVYLTYVLGRAFRPEYFAS